MRTLETSPGDVAQKAANDMGQLLKHEIDQATERAAADAKDLAPAAVMLGAAGIATFFGVQTLILAPAVKHPIRATFTGMILLGAAAAFGATGFGALPIEVRRKIVGSFEDLRARATRSGGAID
jgi:hypothetical protein